MELKAYKLLAELRGRLIGSIIHECRNKRDYCKDKPEELFKLIESIVTPEKWDYHGILDKKDQEIINVLEYLIDDNSTKIKSNK